MLPRRTNEVYCCAYVNSLNFGSPTLDATKNCGHMKHRINAIARSHTVFCISQIAAKHFDAPRQLSSTTILTEERTNIGA